MKFLVFILRTALALFLLLYGIDFFYHIRYLPPIVLSNKKDNAYYKALLDTGYMLQAAYGTQIACGFFLLIDCWAPLFLLILLPITINIFLFLFFFDDDILWLGYTLLGYNLLLMVIYRNAYNYLFNRRGRFASFRTFISLNG
ncbi:MAG TPA: hypothetical protein VHE59_01585 [Mucilaginibacter sp.]|nr:hypothetical protein [Bacteroidota bacterium]HVS90692.1 hypothetical protein [Mucilaginibacter sp.]